MPRDKNGRSDCDYPAGRRRGNYQRQDLCNDTNGHIKADKGLRLQVSKPMNKSETITYKQLRSDGYLVEKPRRNQWQPQDFFYCWDFIAINNKHIRFIQVSSKYFSQRSRADQQLMREFPRPPHTKKEYWRWNQKKKEFIKETI